MPQTLIPILTFVAVASIGAAVVIARQAKVKRLRMRLDQFGDLAVRTDDQTSPLRSLLLVIERLGQRVTPQHSLAMLRKRLAHAGYFSNSAAMIYVGSRMIVMSVGILIALALVLPLDLMLPVKFMLVLGSGFVLSLGPSLYVDMRRNARSTDIRHHLPDAVDMLEICVSAGMGLDMAWNAVSDEIRQVSPTLADEMALANLEIHLGADRATAMRHMADRTDSDDLRSLVATLVQSEKFGTSVGDALRVFAESVREARQSRAAEAAEKLGIKMLFPMIVFILPAILIVMGGGAVIKIMQIFDAL
ncbi:MAG: type II secretion system F family protein [Phycisphaeraceae bacterium]|nr:type II secretion system F family protein [Phycisphaeraceae bacterium]